MGRQPVDIGRRTSQPWIKALCQPLKFARIHASSDGVTSCTLPPFFNKHETLCVLHERHLFTFISHFLKTCGSSPQTCHVPVVWFVWPTMSNHMWKKKHGVAHSTSPVRAWLRASEIHDSLSESTAGCHPGHFSHQTINRLWRLKLVPWMILPCGIGERFCMTFREHRALGRRLSLKNGNVQGLGSFSHLNPLNKI